MLINATIQVVPIGTYEAVIPQIDKAIALIQNSGLKYSVGAFETTIEGEYELVQQLIRSIEDLCYNNKDFRFLIYKKLHVCGGEDITVESKTGKFQ
jgi:uncharacterized protein YqgV (UPF0045/DUF77 family)